MRALAAVLAVGLAGVSLAGIAGAQAPAGPSPVGTWLTEGGKSRVSIFPCAEKLCGRIVWLREPNFPDGSPKMDLRNPEPGKRNQRIVGLNMLWNFVPTREPGVWEEGRIYNPEDGETYKATLTLRPDGKLQVRGYVGISLLGKSQYWERAR